MIPAHNYRHARESGHPGRPALRLRPWTAFAGGDGKRGSEPFVWFIPRGAIYKKIREGLHAHQYPPYPQTACSRDDGRRHTIGLRGCVTDWNVKAGDIAVAAKLPPEMPYRAMAAVQFAVYEAVNAITSFIPRIA